MDFAKTYSTHRLQYGWTTAFTYVHGILPFLLVVIGLSFIIFVYLRNENYDKFQVSDLSDDTRSMRQLSSSSSSVSPSSLSVSVSQENPQSWRTVSVEMVENFHSNWSILLIFIFIQIINLIIVGGTNVLYILIEDNISVSVPSKFKAILPIALSIFKMVWINGFVHPLVKFGIRNKSDNLSLTFNL